MATDAEIRAALASFLHGRTEWPTEQEFIDAGQRKLRKAVMRTGGTQRWALEMGVSGGDRRPGGVRRWTDDAIRSALAQFIGDRPDWPTQREFRKAGLHHLTELVRLNGGAARWASELGVIRRYRQPPQLQHARRTKPPDPRPPATPKPPWPRWTEETVATELRIFLAGRTEWPRFREFVEAGRKGLYQAVQAHGGSREWASRLGVKWVERQRPVRRSSSRPPASGHEQDLSGSDRRSHRS